MGFPNLKKRKPTRRDLKDFSSYSGEYQVNLREGETQTHVKIPSRIEKTIVNRNISVDDIVNNLDPTAILLRPMCTGIRCYDAKYYNKIKSDLNRVPVFPASIDKLGRIMIGPEISERYPLISPLTITASKDGEYFTITSSKKPLKKDR